MADFDLSPTGLRQLALSSYTDALQYNLNAIDRNKIKIALVEALASVQISQELNEIKHILREQKHD